MRSRTLRQVCRDLANLCHDAGNATRQITTTSARCDVPLRPTDPTAMGARGGEAKLPPWSDVFKSMENVGDRSQLRSETSSKDLSPKVPIETLGTVTGAGAKSQTGVPHTLSAPKASGDRVEEAAQQASSSTGRGSDGNTGAPMTSSKPPITSTTASPGISVTSGAPTIKPTAATPSTSRTHPAGSAGTGAGTGSSSTSSTGHSTETQRVNPPTPLSNTREGGGTDGGAGGNTPVPPAGPTGTGAIGGPPGGQSKILALMAVLLSLPVAFYFLAPHLRIPVTPKEEKPKDPSSPPKWKYDKEEETAPQEVSELQPPLTGSATEVIATGKFEQVASWGASQSTSPQEQQVTPPPQDGLEHQVSRDDVIIPLDPAPLEELLQAVYRSDFLLNQLEAAYTTETGASTKPDASGSPSPEPQGQVGSSIREAEEPGPSEAEAPPAVKSEGGSGAVVDTEDVGVTLSGGADRTHDTSEELAPESGTSVATSPREEPSPYAKKLGINLDLTPSGLVRHAIGSDKGAGQDWTAFRLQHRQAVADAKIISNALAEAFAHHKFEMEQLSNKANSLADELTRAQEDLKRVREKSREDAEAVKENIRRLLSQQEAITRHTVQQAVKEQELKDQLAAAEQLVKERTQRLVELDKVRLHVNALSDAFHRRSNEARTSSQAHRIALGILGLQRALEVGAPCGDQLRLLRGDCSQDEVLRTVLDTLPEGMLESGLPTVSELKARYERIKSRAEELSYFTEGTGGMLALLMAKAATKLKVKSPLPSEQRSSCSLLDQAEDHLVLGQLPQAAQAVEAAARGTSAAPLVRSWVDQARARAQVDQAMRLLQAHATSLAASLA